MIKLQSIFEVPAWTDNRSYEKNEPAQISGQYWVYSKSDQTVASGSAFDLSLWNGITTVNGEISPQFAWKPNYNSTEDSKPTVNVIKFGDAYEQRIPDGINNNLLNFNFTFTKDYNESFAIIHFLHQRQGAEAFYFTPPAPYGTQNLFKCPTWTPNFVFFNNNTVQAVFNQVPN